MSEFSHPWNDEDGVKGLWPNGRVARDEAVFERIKARRAEHLRLCHEWRAAAEADGWVFRPTYQNESVETAFRGKREGFTLLGIARPSDDKHCGNASINLWGPDGLHVDTPLVYSMDAIRVNARKCGYCSVTDVDTVRVGFAGRCCKACEPVVRPQIETRGWNS
jgi:hypothetical protein